MRSFLLYLLGKIKDALPCHESACAFLRNALLNKRLLTSRFALVRRRRCRAPLTRGLRGGNLSPHTPRARFACACFASVIIQSPCLPLRCAPLKKRRRAKAGTPHHPHHALTNTIATRHAQLHKENKKQKLPQKPSKNHSQAPYFLRNPSPSPCPATPSNPAHPARIPSIISPIPLGYSSTRLVRKFTYP